MKQEQYFTDNLRQAYEVYEMAVREQGFAAEPPPCNAHKLCGLNRT